MRRPRIGIVGFGTVGRWLAEALLARGDLLAREYDLEVTVTSVATRRGGFIVCDAGLDLRTLLSSAASGRPLREYPGATYWPTALEGLAETGADVLVETSNTDPRGPEPALSHIRIALEQGSHVVTSSKGACASGARDLLRLARERGVQLRMEATVMSGTPVLSTIREGLAGTRVLGIRGILNATANHILTRMADGLDYAAALRDAQHRGYAEPDPVDDIEAHDVVAKIRVLGAVAFQRQLALGDVYRHGIADITRDTVEQAVRDGGRVKLLATARLTESDTLEARVEPVELPLSDPLSRIDGHLNAIEIQTDTVPEITIVGPGAGREQAGQGVLADLLALARCDV